MKCTQEELTKFLETYPRKLTRSLNTTVEPPCISYLDDSLGNWPASVVAGYSPKVMAPWGEEPDRNFYILPDKATAR